MLVLVVVNSLYWGFIFVRVCNYFSYEKRRDGPGFPLGNPKRQPCQPEEAPSNYFLNSKYIIFISSFFFLLFFSFLHQLLFLEARIKIKLTVYRDIMLGRLKKDLQQSSELIRLSGGVSRKFLWAAPTVTHLGSGYMLLHILLLVLIHSIGPM